MAQTKVELEAQLVKVNAAIDRVLEGGQGYSRPDFSMQRARLPELRALRKDLEFKILRASSGGAVEVGDFNTGSGTTESDEWGTS